MKTPEWLKTYPFTAKYAVFEGTPTKPGREIGQTSSYREATDMKPGKGFIVKKLGEAFGAKGPVNHVKVQNPPEENPMDETALHELELYIDNDGDLYERIKVPVTENLSRKAEKGTYVASKAPKAFSYLVEAGAKKYAREFGGVWHRLFPKRLRDELARRYADEFERLAGSEGLRRRRKGDLPFRKARKMMERSHGLRKGRKRWKKRGEENPSYIYTDGSMPKVAHQKVVNYLEDRIGMEFGDAVKAARLMDEKEKGRSREQPEEILRWIDDRMDGGHGVEAYFVGRYRTALLAEFINTGDLYSPTVLYDYEERKFFLTTQGDWREKYEREHP